MPRYRALPSSLRQMRRGARHREYARFYGLYVSMTGKRKRFSFQVKFNRRLTGKWKYRLIVTTVNALKDEEIPRHRQGEVFTSFGKLFGTTWVKVRKLIRYEAGVVYER